MNLVIDLPPSEKAQLAETAKMSDHVRAELVTKLVKEHLHAIVPTDDNDLDGKLRSWQEQEGTKLKSYVTAQALVTQWVEEDAQMTDEEHAENECIYTAIEKNGIPRVQIQATARICAISWNVAVDLWTNFKR